MNRIRRTAAATVLALLLPLPLAAADTAWAAPAPASTSASASDAAAPSPAGQLPSPTGPHAVGRSILHLVDQDRPDPWVPAAGPRRLMVSVYYPARPGTGGPAPYMTTEEARLLLALKGANFPPEALSGTRTWAHEDARPAPGRFPLVLLSPGFGQPRAMLTSLAEDLGSRGYVVALVDHTYEAAGITFPDGRTLACAICDQPPAGGLQAIAESRAKDLSFVIDRLTGRHPAWSGARMIDPRRIGVAGHSIGGDAAAATMAGDPRVRAGVNMDGTFFAPVPASGLGGRPFLMFGAQPDESPGLDSTWTDAWTSLDGWKRWLTVAGADHGSFTDLPLLGEEAGLPRPAGAIAAARGLELTRAYVAAFFDLQLKGVPQPLLDGPSPADPEIAFARS